MDVKAPDVEGVLHDFRGCLNTFDDWALSFWSFSKLDVEQVFKVGDEVTLVAHSPLHFSQQHRRHLPGQRHVDPGAHVPKHAVCAHRRYAGDTATRRPQRW